MNVIIWIDSPGNVSLAHPIAGVARLKRRVCMALRCPSVSEVYLVSAKETPILKHWMQELSKLSERLHWVTMSNDINGTEQWTTFTAALCNQSICLLNADVFETNVLEQSIIQFQSQHVSAVTFQNRQGKAAWHVLDGSTDEWSSKLAKNIDGFAASIVSLEQDAFVIVTEDDVRSAEQWLRQNMGRSGDGFISTYINRPVSTRVTWIISRWRIHPNIVSVLTIVVGIVSALFNLSQDAAYLVGGALLFYASSIFDGCDGELARLHCVESKFGAWLDNIGDCVVVTLYLLTLGVGVGGRTGEPIYTTISMIGFISIWLGLVYWWYVLRTNGAASLTFLLQKINISKRTALQRIRWYQFFYRREYVSAMVTVGVCFAFEHWVIWIAAFNSVLFLFLSLFVRTTLVLKKEKSS